MTIKKKRPTKTALKYCPVCLIVTQGSKMASCYGVVMRYSHERCVTKPVLR